MVNMVSVLSAVPRDLMSVLVQFERKLSESQPKAPDEPQPEAPGEPQPEAPSEPKTE